MITLLIGIVLGWAAAAVCSIIMLKQHFKEAPETLYENSQHHAEHVAAMKRIRSLKCIQAILIKNHVRHDFAILKNKFNL